jgi:hypothetical protein
VGTLNNKPQAAVHPLSGTHTTTTTTTATTTNFFHKPQIEISVVPAHNLFQFFNKSFTHFWNDAADGLLGYF